MRICEGGGDGIGAGNGLEGWCVGGKGGKGGVRMWRSALTNTECKCKRNDCREKSGNVTNRKSGHGNEV